jgi:putative transferase (TIGR04331 family)
MFLITTPDQRFWKTDSKILFLGEWCRLYSQKHVWSQLDHEVCPYHWDDREKLYRDYQLLDSIYESCLDQVAKQLNQLHQTDFPTRYWRIIVGPWLFYIIETLYDRYLSICAVEESDKVSNVLLPVPDSTVWAVKDFSEFLDNVLGDPFNQYLYTEIIQFSGKLPYETKDLPLLDSQKKITTTSPKTLRNLFQKFAKKLGRLLPDSMNKAVFVNSYIKPMELARLQISLGQPPNPYQPEVKAKSFPVNSTMREEIIMGAGSTVFESLLQRIIPSLLPTVYVEGYQDMHQRALPVFPGNPKLIYTTNALYGDEGFKFWASWHVTRGTKLVTSQHGGNYGLAKWSAHETHEIKVSDKNFTWGWEQKGDNRTVPMASGQLWSRTKNLKADPGGNILWVGVCLPRYYSCCLGSVPAGPQFAGFLTDQKRFAEGVPDEVLNLLSYRLYIHDLGWDQKERLTDMLPSVKLYDGKKSFYQQLNEARLCISAYRSTCFLETFAADFPTLLFWNPNHWEARPSAQPYFDELREMEILHDTPESAASKLNTIYKDPLTWWQSPETQRVRKRFCSKFARTSPHWISEWRAELKNRWDLI